MIGMTREKSRLTDFGGEFRISGAYNANTLFFHFKLSLVVRFDRGSGLKTQCKMNERSKRITIAYLFELVETIVEVVDTLPDD